MALVKLSEPFAHPWQRVGAGIEPGDPSGTGQPGVGRGGPRPERSRASADQAEHSDPGEDQPEARRLRHRRNQYPRILARERAVRAGGIVGAVGEVADGVCRCKRARRLKSGHFGCTVLQEAG